MWSREPGARKTGASVATTKAWMGSEKMRWPRWPTRHAGDSDTWHPAKFTRSTGAHENPSWPFFQQPAGAKVGCVEGGEATAEVLWEAQPTSMMARI
jgi:hypothetical protein